MARAMKKASEVDPAKAAVLGPDTLVAVEEYVPDGPVLVIEQALDNFVDLELAERRAADQARAERRGVLGRGSIGRRPSPPLRGSICAVCGSTESILSSPSASGPYRCAFGCSI